MKFVQLVFYFHNNPWQLLIRFYMRVYCCKNDCTILYFQDYYSIYYHLCDLSHYIHLDCQEIRLLTIYEYIYRNVCRLPKA